MPFSVSSRQCLPYRGENFPEKRRAGWTMPQTPFVKGAQQEGPFSAGMFRRALKGRFPILLLLPAALVSMGIFSLPGNGGQAAPALSLLEIVGTARLFALLFQRYKLCQPFTPLRSDLICGILNSQI